MRSAITLALAVLLCSACDGSDISDNPPIQPTSDAAPGDAQGNGDAAADAASRAQAFCSRYETDCGYGTAQHYADEATCLSDFDGFDAATMDCVEGELDAFENDANQQHCRDATGSGSCM